VQKLFNADLLDILPVERGFVYACKETLPDGEEAVAFYIYNQEIDIFEKIPVRALCFHTRETRIPSTPYPSIWQFKGYFRVNTNSRFPNLLIIRERHTLKV
jgi:hypothetical protein